MADREDLLIAGGRVVTADPAVGNLLRGDVRVHRGVVVEVGPDLERRGERVIDASDHIVMPGLIDSHFHMWSSLGRNFVRDGYGYFPAKWATSAHYSPEDFYWSVRLASDAAVNAGITTVHNWDHNTRSPAHADAQLRAHRDSGLRVRYSQGHRDGLPVDEPLSFDDIDRVRDQWFGSSEAFDGLVTFGLNLRGPDLSDEDVFHIEMERALQRRLPVSIHTMQGATTNVDAVALARSGYLGPHLLICHFLAARPEDMVAMSRAGAPLSFAVHSELRLGEAGDPRRALLRFRDAGVTVSLSIDATSIAPIDLFEAMSLAWNLGIPWEGVDDIAHAPLTFSQCIEMATLNGAKALGIAHQVGSIAVGKRADIILIDTRGVNIAPVGDVESTIVRSADPSNVALVMVDGRILKSDGVLTETDSARVTRSAESAAERILARVREAGAHEIH